MVREGFVLPLRCAAQNEWRQEPVTVVRGVHEKSRVVGITVEGVRIKRV